MRSRLGVLVVATALYLFVPLSGYGQTLKITVLDVGQGDSILIQTPNQQRILIDAGPNAAVIHELAEVIPFWDREIDVILLTHPDTDHVAGFNDVLQRYKVGSLLTTDADADSAAFVSFRRAVKELGVKQRLFGRGLAVSLGNNVRLTGIWPNQPSDNSFADQNDSSIVGVLEFNNFEMLLTGDIDTEIANTISQQGQFANVDVLKVPHHGSKYGLTQQHLSILQPVVSIISVGKPNRYGHPSPATIQLLLNANSRILQTSQDGRIEIVVNQAGFSLNAR